MKNNIQLEKALQYLKNSLDSNFQQIAAQIAQVDRPIGDNGKTMPGEAKISVTAKIRVYDEAIAVYDAKILIARTEEKVVDDNANEKGKIIATINIQDEDFDDQPPLI